MWIFCALYIILHFCRNVFYVVTIVLAIKRKEVALQDDADAFQQPCVDPLPLENIIYIGAVTMQLVCEPSYTAFLMAKLHHDFFSNVYCHS